MISLLALVPLAAPAEVNFWSWPGWAGVSAVAQLVALGTFIIAGWRYIVQRKQFPAVVFAWRIIGSATQGDNSYHVLEMHNIGRAPAVISMIHLFDARAEVLTEYRAPTTLGPAGSFQLLVSSRSLERAWMRIQWQTVSNRHRVHVMWRPLTSGGSRAAQYRTELEAWLHRTPVRRLRDWWTGSKVGPGAAPEGIARRGKSSDRRKRALYVPDGVGLASSAQADPDDISDLPYVPGIDRA